MPRSQALLSAAEPALIRAPPGDNSAGLRQGDPYPGVPAPMIGSTKQVSEILLRAEAGGTTTRTKATKHGLRDRTQGTTVQTGPTPGAGGCDVGYAA